MNYFQSRFPVLRDEAAHPPVRNQLQPVRQRVLRDEAEHPPVGNPNPVRLQDEAALRIQLHSVPERERARIPRGVPPGVLMAGRRAQAAGNTEVEEPVKK